MIARIKVELVNLGLVYLVIGHCLVIGHPDPINGLSFFEHVD